METEFMNEAVRLSGEALRTGKGGPFGCVIVRDGVIIARGYNQVTSQNDPTAHAEVVAIREACRTLGAFQLTDCELYTSCEPCPMCLGAIYWARLGRVYYANTREEAAAIGFDDALIYRQIETPAIQRTIPFIHTPHTQARAVFTQWQDNPDKIEY